MAQTIAETAIRITCLACKEATDRVTIRSINPLIVIPDNLIDQTFEDVNR